MRNMKLGRRQFLAITAAFSAAPLDCCGAGPSSSDAVLEAAAIKTKWDANDLYKFLNSLSEERILSLKKSLGIEDEAADVSVLYGKSKDVPQIQKKALWISSNILTYPFRDETTLNYHSLVQWVAEEVDVLPEIVEREPTFILERKIQEQLFAQLWDKLTPAQRTALLRKIDPNSEIKDTAAIVAGSGAVALAALSATVAFSGFAFYTTMAVTISTVAGFFGLTLPFAAYTGASSIVAFLSGPVGWAILGLAALAGVALAGRANVKKTAAFVCQIHALKVASLIEAGVPEADVFGKPQPEKTKAARQQQPSSKAASSKAASSKAASSKAASSKASSSKAGRGRRPSKR